MASNSEFFLFDPPRVPESKFFHYNHCEEASDDIKNMMKHKKTKHNENVSTCRQHLSGFCKFNAKRNASFVEIVS